MSRQSITRFFRVPPDQRIAALMASVAILTLLVPIIQLTPFPASYVIGPIVIIIGALLIIFYVRLISRKELIFGIADYLSTFNDLVTATFIKNVTIFYKGKAVSNLHTALLKIQNKGNTEIEKRDFHNNPIIITFPQEIKVLDVTIKDRSQPHIIIAEPELKGNKVIIAPFSLLVQEWFSIRVTCEFADQGVIEKLKQIELEEHNSFGFSMFKDDDWQKKFEKRTKSHATLLAIILLILSILSMMIYIYTWFFSDRMHLLSFPYQLLLAFVISIFYFGLIAFTIRNSIINKPSP